MALTKQNYSEQGFVGLNGVYQGQSTSELVFLGMTDLSEEYDIGGGKLHVGFDTRIKPAIVRMFYDPPTSSITNGTEIGFIQVGEAKLQGTPVLPSTHSPGIAYRNPYSIKSAFHTQWVDMISAKTLKDSPSFLGTDQTVPPFFPYNGLIDKSGNTKEQFYQHPGHNGSMFKVSSSPLPSHYSLCASLVSPIGLDLDGPKRETIKEIVDFYLDKKFYDYVEDSAYKSGEILTTSDIWQGKEWTETFLERITTHFSDKKILWVEQVGLIPSQTGERMYLLFKLDDPNFFYNYFCAAIQRVSNGQYSFMVFEFDYHRISEIQVDMHAERCERFYEEFPNIKINKPPSILNSTDSYYNDDVLTFYYETYIVNYNTSTNWIKILGSIQWYVTKKFDVEILDFSNPIRILRPRLMDSVARNHNPLQPMVKQYKDILQATAVSAGDANEVQWYGVSPRLPRTISGYGNYCKGFII
jgi:hypothetical protein